MKFVHNWFPVECSFSSRNLVVDDIIVLKTPKILKSQPPEKFNPSWVTRFEPKMGQIGHWPQMGQIQDFFRSKCTELLI